METITIEIDPELKQQAEELFARSGLTLSEAVERFLRQSIREQAISFRIDEAVCQ